MVRKRSTAVSTLGRLEQQGMDLSLHCGRCQHPADADLAALIVDLDAIEEWLNRHRP